jgi:tRNA pseudouridine38-40 synthase
MRNIKLVVEYDGTAYAGFQKQPNEPTIQDELEKALSTLLDANVKVTGAGRTDAGVHARAQVVSFDALSDMICFKMRWSVNGILPSDIVVKSCEEVDRGFDARRDAKARVYKYFILNRLYPSAFCSRYSHFLARKLNVTAMREAAAYLAGSHDFSAFCATEGAGGNVRTIRRIDIFREDEMTEDMISIYVEGDSFLHNMVRIIAGTLIEVGLGNMESEKVDLILQSLDRTQAGPTAPAKGLTLMEVKY